MADSSGSVKSEKANPEIQNPGAKSSEVEGDSPGNINSSPDVRININHPIPPRSIPQQILQMQPIIGNAATGRWIQRQQQNDTPTPAPAPTTVASPPPATAGAAPDPQDIWNRTEPNIIRELLIKLQELGRAAGTQTQEQINALFSPYEDSLESDQTFLQVMSIPLGGGGNMPQGAGTKAEAAGGLAGAAAASAQFIMGKIMDFKSVGQVKAKAATDVGAAVTGLFTSDSNLYMNFETQALEEMRTEFDTSWAQMTPEAKSAPREMIDRVYSTWYPMIARQKYGVASPLGSSALDAARSQVDTALVPVKTKLDDLKSSQRWNRVGAGAVGGAVAGALIGGALGGGIFSIPGALVGGAIGGVVGAIGGYFW